MTTDQTTNWQMILLSIVAAVLVIGGTVWAMRGPAVESRSTISAPGVDIQTQRNDVKIDAPHTSIQKDSSGTRIKAPGVDIELPPKQGQ